MWCVDMWKLDGECRSRVRAQLVRATSHVKCAGANIYAGAVSHFSWFYDVFQTACHSLSMQLLEIGAVASCFERMSCGRRNSAIRTPPLLPSCDGRSSFPWSEGAMAAAVLLC